MEKKFLQPTVMKIIYKGISRWFLQLFVGVHFTDCDFLKKEKQFVIVANHNSHLDTLSLMSSLPGDLLWKVRPVAAQDYWGNTKFKASFSRYFINTLLIRRKKEDKQNADVDPIQLMVDAIDEGYSLIIFPEGTRGLPEQMAKMKSGIGRLLAQRPELKYVPVFMTGMGKSLPKGTVVPLPYNAVVHYGEPTLAQSSDPHEILKEIETKFATLRELYGIKEEDDDD